MTRTNNSKTLSGFNSNPVWKEELKSTSLRDKKKQEEEASPLPGSDVINVSMRGVENEIIIERTKLSLCSKEFCDHKDSSDQARRVIKLERILNDLNIILCTI